jgi:short-subunit dehydrogenase
MNFSGKRIWITGASSGIGKAIAIALSSKNPQLILSGRNQNELDIVGGLCREKGCSVSIVPFDLGDNSSIEKAVKTVFEYGTNIDCLFHFGGISQRSLVNETPVSIDRKIFEVNFFGAITLTKAILPEMIKNGGGHIAITTSIVGKFGFPYRSSYSASKHALHGFFESLRAENTQNNIRVSMIIPGRIKTNISLNALNKKGESYNTMDPGQLKGFSVTKAANQICRKLKREKKEIMVGGSELIMVYIHKFLPRLYYYLSSRIKPF